MAYCPESKVQWQVDSGGDEMEMYLFSFLEDKIRLNRKLLLLSRSPFHVAAGDSFQEKVNVNAVPKLKVKLRGKEHDTLPIDVDHTIFFKNRLGERP